MFLDSYEKPKLLVTSPGSPEFSSQQQRLQQSKQRVGNPTNRFSRSTAGSSAIHDPNIGGRIQIKLGFEASSLQLILTVVCAADLTYRSNGAARNPYAKVSQRNFHKFLS